MTPIRQNLFKNIAYNLFDKFSQASFAGSREKQPVEQQYAQTPCK